jgi:signal transduction histidine kinase
MGLPARLEARAVRQVHRPENPDSGVYAVVRPSAETVTAYATHDAKNMVGILTSNVESLREAIRTNAERCDVMAALDDLEACAQRLGGIMHQALEPKAAVEAFKPRKTRVNLVTVVHAVYQQMRHQAATSDVHLEVRVQCDAPVMIDASLMERVLGNLVDNALRFTPRGRVVRIGCAIVGDEAELTVTDQGPGIDRANTDRIFEPYFTTDTGAFPGESVHSGLGLAFCRTIARLHGGDVRAENTPGDDGTTGSRFIVMLPLA